MTVPVNGVDIHVKIFGDENSDPVLLLHGGLGSIENFGGQIPALAENYKVIAMDTRGHGRSSDVDEAYDYHMFARDVAAVLTELGVADVPVIGWSDGAIIGFIMAIHHPGTISKLLGLGGNSDVAGLRPSVFNDTLVHDYVVLASGTYAKTAADPSNFEAFSQKVFALWGGWTPITEDELRSISIPVTIAAGVYEEAIDENHTRMLAETIPGAELWLIENSSHFALWQQVESFNEGMLRFLMK